MDLKIKKISQTMETYVSMLDALKQWLMSHGVKAIFADGIKITIVIFAIALLAFIANFLVKRISLSILGHIVRKTKNTFQEILLKKRVFHRLAHLAPPIVVYYLIALPLDEFPNLLDFLQRVTLAYITVICLSASLAFVKSLEAYFLTLPSSKNHSIKGYLQVLHITLYSGTIIGIFSILFKIDAIRLFSLLGASVAILILVFKDTILGLVASIQLSVNDMLRPGDWIAIPSQNADGIVQDINLTTVKIQNWDHTFTTVPTYSLVSNSFTNWRGMEESEGRRIKQAIYIDLKSIKFLSSAVLEKLANNEVLNKTFNVSSFVEERHNTHEKNNLTNLEIFRGYVESYLRTIPSIHPDMIILVHYLQPKEFGLPFEVIFFTRAKDIYSYEHLQCELLNHLLAVMDTFELQIHQV